ncbi:hypothetical protein D9M68_763850 [compost metagenome]
MHDAEGKDGYHQHDHGRNGQQRRVGGGKARIHGVLQHVEGAGIEHALHEIADRAEQDTKDNADQHQQVQAPLFAQEQPAEQQQRKHHHDADFEHELQLRIDRHQRPDAEEEHHAGLDQHIERVKAHDRGRQDAVIGDGLEQHRRDGDGIGDEDQPEQFLAAEPQHKTPAALGADGHEADHRHNGQHGQDQQDERGARQFNGHGSCPPPRASNHPPRHSREGGNPPWSKQEGGFPPSRE